MKDFLLVFFSTIGLLTNKTGLMVFCIVSIFILLAIKFYKKSK